MPEPLLIVVGAGGHGRVAAAALAAAGRNILGFTDADSSLWGKQYPMGRILGGDDELSNYPPTQVRLVNGIGSIDVPALRRRVFEGLKARGYVFETIVHPSAVVADDAVLEEGAQIMARAVLQPGVRIGCNTIVNTGAVVDHDNDIGAHTHIAPGATLSGNVRIGENCHIGTGAVIVQGISLGQGSVVGAGAVVVNDHPDGCRIAGVPARTLRAR